MKNETEAFDTLTDDLLLTMRHLHPVLTALLEMLGSAEAGTEEKLARLTAVMERIATALEVQGQRLQDWEQRMAAQGSAAARLSQQIDGLVRHLAREAEGRADLGARIAALSGLLED